MGKGNGGESGGDGGGEADRNGKGGTLRRIENGRKRTKESEEI